MSDVIQTLAQRMVKRKASGVEPYVLIIGAGASISSGCPSYAELVDAFLRNNCPTDFARLDRKRGTAAKREAKLKRFYEEWSGLSKPNRFSFLKTHLSGTPSSGYEHLAWMARHGYLRLVLSANIDQLVEDAFTAAGLIPKTDYDIVVNGPENAGEVARLIAAQNPAVKLVKLHGTLADEESYAWLPQEVFAFMRGLGDALEPHLNGDVVILGHAMNDRNLESLFRQAGGEVWFVNPSGAEGSRFEPVLSVRPQSRAIAGELACFDRFMERLRIAIEAAEAGSGTTASAPAIHRFLKAIGMPEQIKDVRSRYLHLPELYVRPREYEQILRTLDKQHAVVIAGEPHMGKTYTALHILWERFQQGWTVEHMRRDTLVAELQRCAHSMDEFALRHLSSKCLLHLDDPFGEIEYEPLGVLQKEFARLIQSVERRRDCGLIVTSRLGVFGEAFRHLEGADLLRAMGVEADIRVHTSYSEETLREILARYVTLYEPSWASNEDLRRLVLGEVPKIIEAPHNLELFARTSRGLAVEGEILNCAWECREVIPAIRDWILRLRLDEQLLLLLTRSLGSTRLAVLRRDRMGAADLHEIYRGALADAYRDALVEGIPGAAWESAIDSLRDIVSLSDEDRWEPLKFVHPSYAEAVDKAIAGHPGMRGLLLAVVAFAAEHDDEILRAAAAFALPRDAHSLGAGAGDLLQRLKDDASPLVRANLAGALARHYHSLGGSARELVSALARDGEPQVRDELAFWLPRNIQNLDASARDLLRALAQDEHGRVRATLAVGLVVSVTELDPSERKLMGALARDRKAGMRMRSWLASALASQYENVDPTARETVAALARAREAEVRGTLAAELAERYASLDSSGQALVASFSGDHDPEVRGSLARGLAKAYNDLDGSARALVAALARDNDPSVRESLASELGENYHNLDDSGREVGAALARDPEADVRAFAACGLGSNWQNLGASARRLVAALARDRDPEVRGMLASGLAEHYRDLDSSGRAMVAAFVRDRDQRTRTSLARGAADGYRQLDAQGHAVLAALARDPEPEIRASVAFGLGENYQDLDPAGRDLAAELARDEDEGVPGRLARGLACAYQDLDSSARGVLAALARSERAGVRSHAAQGLAWHYEALDLSGQKLVQDLARDKRAGVRRDLAEALARNYEKLDLAGQTLISTLANDQAVGVRREIAQALAENRQSLDASARKLLAGLERQLKAKGPAARQPTVPTRKTRRIR